MGIDFCKYELCLVNGNNVHFIIMLLWPVLVVNWRCVVGLSCMIIMNTNEIMPILLGWYNLGDTLGDVKGNLSVQIEYTLQC